MVNYSLNTFYNERENNLSINLKIKYKSLSKFCIKWKIYLAYCYNEINMYNILIKIVIIYYIEYIDDGKKMIAECPTNILNFTF